MGMRKFQLFRVQQLTVELKPLIFVSVSFVADNGMSHICGVHSYLMCSARFKLKFHQGVFLKSFKHLKKRNRAPSVGAHRFKLRPTGFSTRPESSLRIPSKIAQYIRLHSFAAICLDSSVWASSFFATTISPDVSLSSLCTIPGRKSPFIPLKSFKCQSKAFTKVPV